LLAEVGILEPKDDGTYPRRGVLRARFVLGLDAMGIDPNAVADALASGDLTLGYVEIGGRRPPRSDRTFAELSDEIDVPFLMLERIYVAIGLPRPAPDEFVREEDLPLMKFILVLAGAGLSEGDVLRRARVWGDSARRVAQFQSHYVHTPSRSRSPSVAFATTQPSRRRFGRSAFGRVGPGKICSSIMWRPRSRTRGCNRREPRQVEGRVFADLSGYTRLTGVRGRGGGRASPSSWPSWSTRSHRATVVPS
jgi:hypothetical protein